MFSVISRTLLGEVLYLCRDAVSVFYRPSSKLDHAAISLETSVQHMYHVTLWNLSLAKIWGLDEQHHMQDTNIVYVNSWQDLGQLVGLKFPAAKDLNLGIRRLHDTQEYTAFYLFAGYFFLKYLFDFGQSKRLTSSCSRSHLSRWMDLTRLIPVVRLRWIPAHSWHKNTPKVHDAQSGSARKKTYRNGITFTL